nr:hypothetical protein BaRGS_026816 [Batillaria attramentaria]
MCGDPKRVVTLEHLLGDCHPLLLQEPEELGTMNRLGVIVPDPAPKNVPQMFYGRQIGRSGRPIQSHNLLMLHLIPDHPGAWKPAQTMTEPPP